MMFRDSRGRIRNSDKTPPEVIEAIYRGDEIVLPKLRKEIKGIRNYYEKDGKRKYKIIEEIKYFQEDDFEITKKQFEKISLENISIKKELSKSGRKAVNETANKQFVRWDIIDVIKNNVKADKIVKYRGKEINESNLSDSIKDIRGEIADQDKNDEEEYDIIFDVDFLGDEDEEGFYDEINILDFKESDFLDE